MIYWLTGQPGHGKTTLAKLFKEHLEVNYKHKKKMHIDGDDLREILVKTKVANNYNDNSGINFDDIFTRRLFYSNITKQSNTADNRIEDILFNPKERLLESEKIKKAMADFEQGLWEY
jgi:dephospho-CoA kinase